MSKSKAIKPRRDRPVGLDTWAPFRNPDLLAHMNRLFEEGVGQRATAGVSSPPVDITENKNEYIVSAEIPGVKKQDLTLELEDGVITIAGEKKSEREEEGDKGRWLERTYGAFSRSFSLPSDADQEQINAQFADGVLRVTIAKSQKSKPKAIAVG